MLAPLLEGEEDGISSFTRCLSGVDSIAPEFSPGGDDKDDSDWGSCGSPSLSSSLVPP